MITHFCLKNEEFLWLKMLTSDRTGKWNVAYESGQKKLRVNNAFNSKLDNFKKTWSKILFLYDSVSSKSV